MDWFIGTLKSSVHYVKPVGLGVIDMFLYKTAETWEVGGDAGNAHYSTLSWKCVR